VGEGVKGEGESLGENDQSLCIYPSGLTADLVGGGGGGGGTPENLF